MIFVRYDEDLKPEVRSDKDGLIIKVKDLILDRDPELETDLLMLSSCMIHSEGTVLPVTPVWPSDGRYGVRSKKQNGRKRGGRGRRR